MYAPMHLYFNVMILVIIVKASSHIAGSNFTFVEINVLSNRSRSNFLPVTDTIIHFIKGVRSGLPHIRSRRLHDKKSRDHKSRSLPLRIRGYFPSAAVS